MTIFKKISLTIGILCLSVAAGAIVLYYTEDNNVIANSDKILKNSTFINEDTRIIINTKYALCGHNVIREIVPDEELFTMNKDKLLQYFKDYEYISFSNNVLYFQDNINEYCDEHFLIKEVDGKIKIYKMCDGVNLKEIKTLNIELVKLRQNDRYIFKNAGLKIDSKEDLYKFLEDYEIYYEI